MARIRTKNNIDNRQIGIYVRKSKVTESGKSIEIQKEKCIALACAQFDITEDAIIIYEDEGKSGFYADRPRYKDMLRDIENNKIKAVVCYKIDRISRRTIDLLNLVQQMEQKDIAFVSVSDHDIDTTSRTGKIMISLLAAIAEFERDIIAERITDNMYELAKEGRWLGGECPLGYYSQKEKLMINGKKTTINHLEPVEEDQIAVRRLFEHFLQTSSLTGTATVLNREGFKTKKDKDFTLVAVKNILQNPVYAIADIDMQSYFKSFDVPIWADEKDFDGERGIMAYNKTEQIKETDAESTALDPKYTQKVTRRDITDWIIAVGKHKGIISGADWIKAQNMIAEISHENSARPKEVSKALLSGLVRCVECGSRMFVRAESGRYNPDGTLRFRYVCDVKYRKKGSCENSPNVKGYELDNFVVEQICSMSTGAGRSQGELLAHSSGENTFYSELLNTKSTLMLKSKETEKKLNALKKRLSQIELDIQSQISNLRTAPESVKQAIYADIEALSKEKKEKQNQLDAIYEDMQSQDNQIADIEKAKQTIMDFPKLIKLVDYEGKLQLLRRVLECVIVKGDIVHIFLKGTDSSDFFVKAQERSDVCHTEHNSICYIGLHDTSAVLNFYRKILYHMICDILILNDDATVAERIRFYRLKRDLTGYMLAELIGMSRYAIIYYENNQAEPLLEDLKKIANALGIEADKLYDDYYRFLDYPYTERIKQIRTEHKLLQRELGSMLDVGRKAIERWEHGVNVVSRETWEQLGKLNLL